MAAARPIAIAAVNMADLFMMFSLCGDYEKSATGNLHVA